MTISSYVLHRHKLLWENPDAFEPERFMPVRSGDVKQYSHIPFGAGPRICMDKNLELMEAVLLLARFAQRFDCKLKSGHL